MKQLMILIFFVVDMISMAAVAGDESERAYRACKRACHADEDACKSNCESDFENDDDALRRLRCMQLCRAKQDRCWNHCKITYRD